MPQESLGFVRMIWICPNCDSKNPGNFRFCRGCGAPQPSDVQFHPADENTLVTDIKEIEQARQGADVHCGFCGARNQASAKVCLACGADLATGARRESGTVIGAYQVAAAAGERAIVCPNCATPNPAGALVCKSCGAPLPATARPAAPASAPAARMPRWVFFAVGGAILLCVILAIAFFSRTSTATATVSRHTWERRVAILALVPVTRSDWKAEIPAEARLGACEARLYETSDQPDANSKKVCGTPYTVDRGNGYAEVVQDCQYEIYKDYCEYTVQDWAVTDTAIASGSDEHPAWPQFQLASGQRAGDQEEIYKIVFSTADGEKTYATSNIEEYTAARPGTRWTLTVNAFGNISAIAPAQ